MNALMICVLAMSAIIDQEQYQSNMICHGVFAQTFICGQTGRLREIDFVMDRYEPAVVTFAVARGDGFDHPLVFCATSTANVYEHPWGAVYFSGLDVTAGDPLTVLWTDPAVVTAMQSGIETYPEGSLHKLVGAKWVLVDGDLLFRTWVEPTAMEVPEPEFWYWVAILLLLMLIVKRPSNG